MLKQEDFGNSTQQEIEDFYSRIRSNIKRLRTEKGLSQLDLALECGIKSLAFFSNAESGRYGKHFNIRHLYQIAKALDVDISELFR